MPVAFAPRHHPRKRADAAADLQQAGPIPDIMVRGFFLDALNATQCEQPDSTVLILWAGFQPLYKYSSQSITLSSG